jgi:chromosome segregation ATPase
LEHQRNQLLKQQKQEIHAIIHDCQTQFKNASSENKTQIKQDCKIKIKESEKKYVDLKKQLQIQLEQLRAQFRLQIHDDKKETHTENEITHLENIIKKSENEITHLENIINRTQTKLSNVVNTTNHSETKLPNLINMTKHFEKKLEKQNDHVKSNHGDGQKGHDKNDD